MEQRRKNGYGSRKRSDTGTRCGEAEMGGKERTDCRPIFMGRARRVLTMLTTKELGGGKKKRGERGKGGSEDETQLA